ncbi:hypothetical protein FRB99_003658, partial [Tulasnella sp. 403]
YVSRGDSGDHARLHLRIEEVAVWQVVGTEKKDYCQAIGVFLRDMSAQAIEDDGDG